MSKIGEAFPCGQCMPCRLNKRRVWAHRMMLEADCHEYNSFVTLTYAPEHCPKDGSLEPSFVKKWFKNLRDDYRKKTDKNLRFYLVGEYGDKSWRPHYHVIIFGYPPCLNEYRKKWLRKRGRACDCDNCVYIQSRWSKGFTDVSEVTLHSVQYVAGYVTKKMTKANDSRLDGKYPEFARMSLKPGIGHLAVDYIADSLFDKDTGEVFLQDGDVPVALSYNGKQMPLGRYLRRKLQQKLGVTDEKRIENYKAWQAQLRSMYGDALLAEKAGSSLTLKKYLVAAGAAKVAKMERVHQLKQRKKTL